MEQLTKMVADKTGISPDQAKSAVDAVLGFLKDKIPGIGSQLDGVMSDSDGELADVAKEKLAL